MGRVKEKIDDFGEKIGGAKKDYYMKHGIRVEDIKDLNHRQLLENVIKPHVFRKPDYEQLVSDGLSKEVVFFMKRLYDSFPTKFQATSTDFEVDKSRAIEYIKLGNLCEEGFSKIKTMDDFDNFGKLLIDNKYLELNKFQYADYKYYNVLNKYKIHYDLSKLSQKLTITKSDIRDARAKIEDTNFPYKMEAWRKSYKIVYWQNNYIIYKKGGVIGSDERIKDGFTSREDAEKYLTDVIKPQAEKERKDRYKGIEPRPQLKHIKRKGQSYRDGKDITTDDVMNTFKFRGGEFGNWNNQLDRQQNLNLAYDSFLDLAKVLNVSPSAVSLGGTLAIAFGSRGRGGALAHYEPGSVVINLTKLRGAGCLAHEWGHALDDYLSRLSGNTSVDSFMSSGNDTTTSKIAETAEKINAIMKQIEEKVLDANEIQNMYEDKIEDYKERLKTYVIENPCNRYGIDETKKQEFLKNIVNDNEEVRINTLKELVKEAIKSDENFSMGHIKYIFDRNSFAIKECQECIKNKHSLVGTIKDKTDFLKHAESLDSSRIKPYFTNRAELFARAFEGYVEYKIHQNKQVSDYLVYGTGIEPLYIANKREQELIFNKFDDFIEHMKELDRSNLISDNYKLVEDLYENKDFKEISQEEQQKEPQEEQEQEQVENLEEGINEVIGEVEVIDENVPINPIEFINNNKEFRVLENDNQVNVVLPNEHVGYVDIINFDKNNNFLSFELHTEKEVVKNLVSVHDFKVTPNFNDSVKEVADKIHGLIDITNVVDTTKNLLIINMEGSILSEKVNNETFNVTMYDNQNRLMDAKTLHSADEIKSLMLKSPLKMVSEASPNVINQYKKSQEYINKFIVAMGMIDKFDKDGSFEVQYGKGCYQVDYLESSNLYKHYSLTGSNNNLEVLQKYELANKIIEEKAIEIRESSLNKIQRELSEKKEKTEKILSELKTADAFVFKNDELNKHITVIPSTEQKGQYEMSYLNSHEILSQETMTLEEVAKQLVDEGLTAEDLKQKCNLSELKIDGIKSVDDIKPENGNITFDELKAKGNIAILRVDNENIDLIKNLDQDYYCYKKEGYTNVVVLKDELIKAKETLKFRDKEIGRTDYNTFKSLPGANRYIYMSKNEFEKFKSTDINYSAFQKNKGINVVVKEENLKQTLESIGRTTERTLGNIKYSELKAIGEMMYKQYEKNTALQIINKLTDENIKFSAFHKGEKYINIALNKSNEEKFYKIVERVKTNLSIKKGNDISR